MAKSEHKKLIKECDDLWSEIIKKRAGYKSELSGVYGVQLDKEIGSILQAHHIAKKPNLRLRYDLDNGICLTKWEHRYGIHGNHEEEYRKRIKQVRGEDVYERLSLLRNVTIKDLRLTKLFLLMELKKDGK